MIIGFDAKRAVANFTGLGNYSRFVIHNLQKYYPDNSYKLFTPKRPSDSKLKDLDLNNENIITKEGFSPLWRSFGINKYINKEQVDIYHGLSNELPFGIRNSKAKSIVTIHDLIFLKFPNFYPVIDRHIYDIKAKYACKHANKIIAVSECTKKDIVELYGINADKIEVVYQGCNEIFKEKATDLQKESVKKQYNLPDKFVLSIGSIEDRKNILLIVKALKQIPNIHFVAIGRQRKYAKLVQQYADSNGLSDRVHLLSNIPLVDLPAILQQSQIFIYPSLYEGFGIPIIEALYSGVPVIAATGSCLEEAGGADSIYVNPYDEDELAEAIKRVLLDKELSAKMVENGLKYVSRFSDEACTQAMMNVYNNL